MLKSCVPSNCGSRLQEVGGDVGTSIQLQDFFSTDWGMPPVIIKCNDINISNGNKLTDTQMSVVCDCMHQSSSGGPVSRNNGK